MMEQLPELQVQLHSEDSEKSQFTERWQTTETRKMQKQRQKSEKLKTNHETTTDNNVQDTTINSISTDNTVQTQLQQTQHRTNCCRKKCEIISGAAVAFVPLFFYFFWWFLEIRWMLVIDDLSQCKYLIYNVIMFSYFTILVILHELAYSKKISFETFTAFKHIFALLWLVQLNLSLFRFFFCYHTHVVFFAKLRNCEETIFPMCFHSSISRRKTYNQKKISKY